MRTNTDVRLHFNLEINLTAAPPFPYYNALPATKFSLSQDIPWYIQMEKLPSTLKT